jgi:hypothetical protein
LGAKLDFMKLADLAILLHNRLGAGAPDKSLLRVWTDDLVLVPDGGGSSGKHRVYSEGEAAWAMIAAAMHRFGLRGASLKAAMVALRTWNDRKESLPISDPGFHEFSGANDATPDQIAVVRSLIDAERPAYRVVENLAELGALEEPHIRLSLAWIKRLLSHTGGAIAEPVDEGT